MPELPEVETTRRGIEPHVIGHKVTNVIVRDRRLRWAIPPHFEKQLAGGTITGTRRRAKYLLMDFDSGCLLVHLGMSGSLRMVAPDEQPRKHDHVDIEFDNGLILRYHDPRRFGRCIGYRVTPMHCLITLVRSHSQTTLMASTPPASAQAQCRKALHYGCQDRCWRGQHLC